MSSALFKINELFETIQGEGTFTGVPSIFLRLQGCPVGCSWCDTKQVNTKVTLCAPFIPKSTLTPVKSYLITTLIQLNPLDIPLINIAMGKMQ